HNLVHELTHTVTSGPAVGEYFPDGRAVAETDARAGRINNQLLRQIAGHLLLVVEQQLFERADVAEFPAVGKFAAGIHWQRVVKSEFLSALGDALREFAFGFGTIAFAPAAHDVEVFEREACG